MEACSSDPLCMDSLVCCFFSLSFFWSGVLVFSFILVLISLGIYGSKKKKKCTRVVELSFKGVNELSLSE